MKVLYGSPKLLIPYNKNPRDNRAAIEAVRISIREFGFNQPIVVDKAKVIIVGHTRREAAIEEGIAKVPYMIADHLSKSKARAYRLADNRTNQNSFWLEEQLKDELMALSPAERKSTAFTDDELENILEALFDEGLTDPDHVPEPQKKIITKTGDLWRLGKHRLLCGDASKREDVAALLGKKKINVAVTSPPYASQRVYVEDSGFKPVRPADYTDWFAAIQENIAAVLAKDGSFFLNIKEHADAGQRNLYVKDLTLAFVRKWQWQFVDEFVWAHTGTPKGPRQRFKNGWEPIFQFTKNRHKFRPKNVMHATDDAIDWGGKHPSMQDGRMKMDQNKNIAKDHIAAGRKHRVVGQAYPSNVLSIGKNMEALSHGAIYPMRLPQFFIRGFSDEGDNVFDPFIGSGTTMIAAEITGRNCFGIEIAAQYVDVAVKRWENFTGKKAKRIPAKPRARKHGKEKTR